MQRGNGGKQAKEEKREEQKEEEKEADEKRLAIAGVAAVTSDRSLVGLDTRKRVHCTLSVI